MKPGARPNPYLATEAQREAIARQKAAHWRLRNPRLQRLPTPNEDEAAALVAAYLARGGAVTVCPPCAAPDGANNAGVPWRMGGGVVSGDGRVTARRHSK